MSHSSSATTGGCRASAAGTVSHADPAADISNATPGAVALVTAFLRDKTARDPERFMANFSRSQLTCGWDGRHFGTATTQAIRRPQNQFATDFGEAAVGEQSPAALHDVVSALCHAFATGDAAAAADLFTTDATFEDLTLHLSFTGRPAIQGFLNRSFTRLPYGLGTSVRHTVGNAQGGGYEWSRQDASVNQGVIALELHQSRIIRFTTVWDGSLINDAAFIALLSSTLEH